jgi:hypothetical protein
MTKIAKAHKRIKKIPTTKAAAKQQARRSEKLRRDAVAQSDRNLARVEGSEGGETPIDVGNGKPKVKIASTTKSAKVSRGDRRMSALDGAARVLTESKQQLRCKQMIELMAKKGYWNSPSGKTPEATIHAAIIREIRTKGKDSRFQKTGRGMFKSTHRK